ncbi:hypothetical protein Tco_0400280 [Tanacetum coccineum]
MVKEREKEEVKELIVKEEESNRQEKTWYLGKKMKSRKEDQQNDSEIYRKWRMMSWVHTLMTEAGLVIHMLIEKKYPLRKKVLLQMLELKLESEEDSTMALELIRFVKKQVAELEPEDPNGDEEDL